MRLSTRLFLGSSLLVVIAVAGAAVLTWIQSSRVAREQLRSRLEQGALVREVEADQRYQRLQLLSDVFITDANLVAYVTEAESLGDSASILDILLGRQGDLGFDYAIVTDPEGIVLARTDRPRDVGSDLSELPLMRTALEDFSAAGAWAQDDALYHQVAVPIVLGLDLWGFFVSAYRIDDDVARSSRLLSDAHITHLFRARHGPLVVSGSSLDPPAAQRLAVALSLHSEEVDSVLQRGTVVSPLELTLDGQRWVLHLSPLEDAIGGPVGLTVANEALSRSLGPYRRISMALALSGVMAILLVSLLTHWLASRSMRPIRTLVEATRAARRGEYDVDLVPRRKDEVGELAGAFDELVAELREKHDMELYVAALQRNLPESASEHRTLLQEVEASVAAVVALEFRRASLHAKDPGAAVSSFSEEISRAREAVRKLGGRLESIAGHRVFLLFSGAGAVQRGIGAAARIFESQLEAGLSEDQLPVTVITHGDVSRGTLHGVGATAMIGRTVAMAESLLREAAPGDVLLSETAAKELAGEAARQGVRLVEGRGITTPLRFAAIDTEAVRRLSLSVDRTTMSQVWSQLVVQPGTVLDERYEILAELGSGGMGVVYKARDRELEDVVALKMLRAPSSSPELLERIKQELKLARMITHPNVLRVYDFGDVGGTPFLSMEYVPGITLRRLIERFDRIPYSAALRLARQICEGLAAVHRAGVLHCDLKPENVILEPAGNARLMDFGISQQGRRIGPDGSGLVRGTPRYLAPEQIAQGGATVASDIYSCGVVLYELFTGGYPYSEPATLVAVLRAIREEDPKSPNEVWEEIPPQLEELILRCLQKDPESRYESVDQLLEDLEKLRPRGLSVA